MRIADEKTVINFMERYFSQVKTEWYYNTAFLQKNEKNG